MERAFPPGVEVAHGENTKKKSASILVYRPQQELDYINYVIKNWQLDVEVRKKLSGRDRDEIIEFRQQHPKGNKYIHQYLLEEVCPPGGDTPFNVVHQIKKSGKHKGKNHIVLSREQLLD